MGKLGNRIYLFWRGLSPNLPDGSQLTAFRRRNLITRPAGYLLSNGIRPGFLAGFRKPRVCRRVFILGGLGIIFFILGCQSRQIEYIDNSKETQHKNESSKNILEKKWILKEFPREEEKIIFGRNPFLTHNEEKEFGAKKEAIGYLNLSAVFYAPGHSYAVINGRIVREKDTIDNKKIVNINPESVILKDGAGAEYIIEMKKL